MISLLPFILAICIVVAVSTFTHCEKSDAGGKLGRRTYRPKLLTWQAITVLIGVNLSAMALLELSCHIFPELEFSKLLEDAPQPDVKIFPRGLGKRIPQLVPSTTVTLHSKPSPKEFLPDDFVPEETQVFTARPEAISATITTIPTTTATTTISLSSTESATEIQEAATPIHTTLTTTVTNSTSTAIATPPPIKADGSASDVGSGATVPEQTRYYMTPTHYFIAKFLPTLLSLFFLIPWKLVHLHISSLYPFQRLSSEGGASGYSSILTSHYGLKSVVLPAIGVLNGQFIVLTASALQWLSALIPPLASESIRISLVGSCSDDNYRGCDPVAMVSKVVVRLMVGVLALMSILSIVLLWGLRRWTCGAAADPRSICGIATLCQSEDLRRVFAGNSTGRDVGCEIGGRVGPRVFRLGAIEAGPPPQEVGISLVESNQAAEAPLMTGLRRIVSKILPASSSRRRDTATSWSVISAAVLLAIFGFFLAALNAIIIWYRQTITNTAFEHFLSGQGFGVNFMFTVFGVVIGFVWMAVFQCKLPYRHPISQHLSSLLSSRSPILQKKHH